MPIDIIQAADAVRLRKTNPLSQWPRRESLNRVEPIAKPGFDVPFSLTPGERIFTIGSCFARNIETELAARGFAVPMSDLFRSPELAGCDRGIINNYATPSIFNELAWAFGVVPFRDEMVFAELKPGAFVDLHLAPTLRPEPLAAVRARREAVLGATRLLAECRVLIMTLGLTEVWYDNAHELYLNTPPRPSLITSFPDRFALHVLDFDETLDHLRRAFDVAFAHGHPELRVVLTVSPVAMAITHRPMDVLVANSYSKSLLRTVAEHIVARDPRIAYFPSYESVMLSDRGFAWMGDLVHVTPEIVAINVGRMVDAYAGVASDELPVADGAVAESIALDRAARARAAKDEAFFARNAAWVERSEPFAVEHAKLLMEIDRHAAAIDLLSNASSTPALVSRAKAELEIGRADLARATLDPVCRAGSDAKEAWYPYIAALLALGEFDEAIDARDMLVRFAPNDLFAIETMIALHHRSQGDEAAAAARLEQAMGARPGNKSGLMLELAHSYAALDRNEEAWALLAHVDGANARIRKLRKLLASRGVVLDEGVAMPAFATSKPTPKRASPPTEPSKAKRKSGWPRWVRRLWKRAKRG